MRSRFSARIVAGAALVFALSSSAGAYADDISDAEILFSEGLAAMKREDFKSACSSFFESNKKDPSPGTQINLAVCNEKQGKLATAWGWYRTAAGLAEQRGQRERAESARADATRVEKSLRKLVINVKEPGLSVTRDGGSVPEALLGKEVPVDPGEHLIEVTGKGKRPWTSKVTLAAGPGVDRIDVPVLESAPADASGPKPGDPDYRPPVVSTSDGAGQRTVGLVVGGLGILGLLAAGGVQILALNEGSKRDEFRDQEQKARAAGDLTNANSYRAAGDSRDESASNNQLIAIISGAGGIVLLGVGAVLFFSAPKKSSAAGTLQVTPMAGLGTGGLLFTGSF